MCWEIYLEIGNKFQVKPIYEIEIFLILSHPYEFIMIFLTLLE